MQRLLLTKGENAGGDVYFHDYKLFFVRGAARPPAEGRNITWRSNVQSAPRCA